MEYVLNGLVKKICLSWCVLQILPHDIEQAAARDRLIAGNERKRMKSCCRDDDAMTIHESDTTSVSLSWLRIDNLRTGWRRDGLSPSS